MITHGQKVESFRSKSRKGIVRGVRIIHGDRASVDLIARSQMDFIYLDQQHGTITIRDIFEISALLAPYDIVVLVRTADNGRKNIGLALDAGAHGVLAPEIETAAEAKEIVASLRFPPSGNRSWGSFAAGNSGYASYDDFVSPICWALIESKSALSEVEKIVKVEGIDGIYVGRFDLALSMSVSPEEIESDKTLDTEIRNILKQAEAVGMPAGTSGDFPKLTDQGFRILTVRSELELLSTGLKKYLTD
jgi:4-hydroxy-2-oxoheptanedioate aldolase